MAERPTQGGPQATEDASRPAIPVDVANKLDHLDIEHGRIRGLVGDIQDVNRLILVVMFVGFLVLLFSLGGLVFVAIINDDPNASDQAAKIQHVEDQQQALKLEVKRLSRSISSTGRTGSR
jgi:hypothetical protein